MQIYDISLTISPNIPTWPGDPRPVVERIEKIEAGASANITRLDISAHTGTHVDAPYHFLGGDAPTVEKLSLKVLTGRCYVLHLPDDVELITAAILERADIPPRTRRLLFRTRNSQLWTQSPVKFRTDFVAISADAAQLLVEKCVKLVGIDYLSVAPYYSSQLTHEILLKAGIVLLEGLDLSQVTEGRYSLYCLPLKLAHADGAPARAILMGV